MSEFTANITWGQAQADAHAAIAKAMQPTLYYVYPSGTAKRPVNVFKSRPAADAFNRQMFAQGTVSTKPWRD